MCYKEKLPAMDCGKNLTVYSYNHELADIVKNHLGVTARTRRAGGSKVARFDGSRTCTEEYSYRPCIGDHID